MTRLKRGGYVKRTGDLICEQIAIGKTLQQALDVVGYLAPSIPSFWKWLSEHPEFREKYDKARQMAADMLADKLQELGEEVIKNPRAAPAYQVAIRQLQWSAEVRNPAKYGKNKESKQTKTMDPGKLRQEIKRLEKELGVAESKVVPLKVVDK